MPLDRSLAELAAMLRRRETTAVDVTEACLGTIRERDGATHAFVTVTADDARAAARAADAALAAGKAGRLAGVPVAVKDLFAVRGVVRSNGSAVCDGDHPATADAAVVARLRAAGAVVVGTTHLHELAFGPTGVNPALGTPANPWQAGRVPGGSSSGSGAAVSARLVPTALGSDTGGSIRVPASFCGITGLKPTYGRVSRAGMMPLSWSLDHAGPLARTVEDVAILLGVLAGHDPADPTSARLPVPDYTRALGQGVRGLRIAVPRAFCTTLVDGEVGAAFEAALGTLEHAGATVRDVDIPTLRHASPMLGATIMSEALSALGPLVAARREQLGVEVRVYLELAKLVTAEHYLAAQRLRSRLYGEMRDVLARADVLATPATPIAATRVGDLVIRLDGADVGVVETICRLTGPFNLTGLPALALPCGFTRDGRPIGLQLAGRPFDEETVLAAGHVFQRLSDWHLRQPPR